MYSLSFRPFECARANLGSLKATQACDTFAAGVTIFAVASHHQLFNLDMYSLLKTKNHDSVVSKFRALSTQYPMALGTLNPKSVFQNLGPPKPKDR